ncbi:MAG: CoB--CoM heterodisulfide reductase iron-sulfur subunit A family protein [Bacteroidales bacterium]|nr:CoB--CoM heterodisulfide reductase iron-sulfur subunit A family protein [Bacteroidales bacterium]
MDKRLGVYICHCGGNISDYVDVEKVREAIENDGCVLMSKTTQFACSDSNQKEMVLDIQEQNLSGIVVASCSPKLHLNTFRQVSERADLNKYNYVHANIREQASWAHSDDKKGATEKTILLVKAAIAKARLAESLTPNKIMAINAVAVIGGGVAGLKAAISLSDKNTQVVLIEREPFIGGRVGQWGEMFTTNQTGNELISSLYAQLVTRKNVQIYTNSEVVSYSGSIGDFSLKIETTPRYISQDCDAKELQKAMDVCPVVVPDPFTFGITNRKAIYGFAASQYPKQATIDDAACTHCGACEKVSKNIDLSLQKEMVELHVGSVLMATGFDPYTPENGEFGYAENESVITLPQFKKLIDNSESKLIYKGKEIKNIAYIYCVGSRQGDEGNSYCSRYCCTSTIHSAIIAKKKFKNIHNFHFNRGIRTYGKQEVLYAESLKLGDLYLQATDDSPAEVYSENGRTWVKVNDILTESKEMQVEVDLVVLVTGMVPRSDKKVSTLFKLPKGRDRFLNEIHMKLRPVETAIDGITIAGTCQSPKNVAESVNSSLSAATKAFSYISKGELETEPIVVEIDAVKCTWCNECSTACPFDAITQGLDGDRKIAVVNTTVCKGCGMCTPVCPTDAIDLVTFSSKEIMNMIDALTEQI